MASGFLCFLLFTIGLCHTLTDQQLEQLYGKTPRHDDLLSIDINANSWVSDQADTFRDEAGARLFIGAISNSGDLNNGDQNYRQVLSAQYSLQTAENECKWGSTEPNQQGVFNWGPCDAASDYAQVNSNGAAFRGHNLCWGQSNPTWLLNGGYSPSQLLSILQNHITHCIQRYNGTTKTRAYCWDVVNEAISDDSDPSQIYKSAPPWYPAIADYVDQAFLAARASDKTMRLFYNDYGGEGAGTKSDKIYNMVASMKQRGIPIDGVGLQMHVSTSYYPNPSDVMANMKRLGALGLEVQITEMDVSCPDQNFSLQAQIYASMLQACMSVPACTSFQSWGFTDKYTWLGSGNYPLPFDINYNPKAAVTSITNTISAYYGINVQLYTCTNQPQQTWSWPPDNYGEVMVKSNSWCLDVQNYGTTNGANVWAYPCHPTDTNPAHQTQNWSYNSSSGALVSKVSGRCLDASTGTSKGSNVQIYDCNGSANQKWTWNSDGTIRGSQSGLCLDMGSFK